MTEKANLSSQVAIVTGCARGIGASVVRLLASHGVQVIGIDVDESGGEETMRSVAQATGHGTFRHLDISDAAAVAVTVEKIADEYGRLDILVNNAGVTRTVGFFELSAQDWNPIVDVNLKGSLAMMQAAARIMVWQRSGSIVNVSSIAGKGYRKTSNIAYAATKGALVTMTRVGAAQLGKYNIRVNAICPGPTETDIMADWIESQATSRNVGVDSIRTEIFADSALGRGNRPEDVARAVLFLVSEDSVTITGQSINIDGGIIWD